MKFLAWDTSSKAGLILAFEGDAAGVRMISEWHLNVEAAHSEQLLWGLHQTLTACGWKLPDVDALAVGTGPGSFTGLRIGVSTAKALTLAAPTKLIGFESLSPYLALAAELHFQSRPSDKAADVLFVFARDAAKGEWFVAHGTAQKILTAPTGAVTGVFSPGDLTIFLKEHLAGRRTRKVCLLGETASLHEKMAQLVPKTRQVRLALTPPLRPSSMFIARLVIDKFIRQAFDSEDTLIPFYARLSEPELKLQQGLLKPARTRGLVG